MSNKAIKFSEDVIPIGELKINPGKIVRRLGETRRPMLLTSRGKGVAVMQDLAEYENAEEEKAFMRAVVQGIADIESGRTLTISELEKRLGLA
jgi:prevent-host-death family protein